MASQPGTPTSRTTDSPPSNGGGTTDTAKEEARHVAETGRQRAGQVAGEAQTQAADLARTARDEALHRVDDELGKVAGFLSDIGDELEEMADCSDSSNGRVSALARDGAQAANGLSQRLETGGLNGAWHDAESFARRRPGMFLAAAFGVGLALGRVTRNADMDSISDEMNSADGPQQRDGSARPAGPGTVTPPAAIPATAATAPSDVRRTP